MASTLQVNTIGPFAGNDIFIEAAKTITGTAAQFKITGGTTGQALTTDGNGLLSFTTVGGGGGVAPKFGGPNDFALFIEWHKPVLLPTNANALHLARAGLGLLEGSLEGGGGGFAPSLRVLFLRAGRQSADELVGALGAAEHFAILGIHHQCLGGLRAAIDAEVKFPH